MIPCLPQVVLQVHQEARSRSHSIRMWRKRKHPTLSEMLHWRWRLVSSGEIVRQYLQEDNIQINDCSNPVTNKCSHRRGRRGRPPALRDCRTWLQKRKKEMEMEITLISLLTRCLSTRDWKPRQSCSRSFLSSPSTEAPSPWTTSYRRVKGPRAL